MPFHIIRADITKVRCDAIVNAANSTLMGGGGVDGAIHRAAGIGLVQECAALGGCETGQAKYTRGYQLPCDYIIHTVGPIWNGGGDGEEELLTACYTNSLLLAEELHCRSIAFPMISAGAYGYPKEKAFQVAVNAVKRYLKYSNMEIYLVVYGQENVELGQTVEQDLREYIEQFYVDTHSDSCVLSSRVDYDAEQQQRTRKRLSMSKPRASDALPVGGPEEEDVWGGGLCDIFVEPKAAKPKATAEYDAMPCAPMACSEASLEALLDNLDESFQQMLLRKIDERGMTDAECYKRANLDRKLFSKIRRDIYYRPKKTTAVAFAVSLKLSLSETKELLEKAGYSLSHSSKFDIIIEYFILNGNYDIYEINAALFRFDQLLLGV